MKELKSIRLYCLITFIFILACKSSSKNDFNSYLESEVYSYINYFKSLDNIGNHDFLLKVKSENSELLTTYKIYMKANLLEKGEVPSKIDSFNGYKIAYFTEKLSKKDSLIMLDLLEKNNFYSKSPFLVNSNYPTWKIVRENNGVVKKVID